VQLVDKIATTVYNGNFDKVNHRILLNKLDRYCIRGQMLAWLESYLYNRRQYGLFEGIQSNIQNITCVVLLGLLIYPVLFLTYVNDFVTHQALFSFIYLQMTRSFLSLAIILASWRLS